MTSLSLKAEDPIEYFEWGLPNAQIWCFQLLHDLRYIDCQTGDFSDLEQLKVDSHSASLGKSKLILLAYFSDFGQVTIIFLSLDKPLGCKKQSKLPLTKNSGTTHRVWHKSFSKIQSAGIKNWVPQLISRFQRLSLSFVSVTRFSDLSNKRKCAHSS